MSCHPGEQRAQGKEGAAAALHSDPYFYHEHVTVSVEKGAVVLHGFVFSEWDLLEGTRIARRE